MATLMGSQVFQIDRWRMALGSFLCLAVVATLPLLARVPNIWVHASRLLAYCLIVCLGFLVANSRWLLHKGPGLALSPSGIESPLSFSGIIPWTEVTKIDCFRKSLGTKLVFNVDKSFAQFIKWRGAAILSGRRNGTFNVYTMQLLGSKEEIERAIVLTWQTVRFEATKAGLPVAHVKPEGKSDLGVNGDSVATYVLLGVFILVYCCEFIFAAEIDPTFTPTTRTLIFLGADLGGRVRDAHEYWRMFTAPLMHANLKHLLSDSLIFWWAGQSLEKIVGWKWLLGIFALTAIGGEIATVVFLAPNIVDVGASGGVVGILVALYFVAGRVFSALRMLIRGVDIRILLFTALLSIVVPDMNINYFAHIGGGLVGAVLGLALVKCWKLGQKYPPYSNVMALLGIAYFTVAIYAIFPIMKLLGH